MPDSDDQGVSVPAELILHALQTKAQTDPLVAAHLEAAVWRAAWMASRDTGTDGE